MVKIASDWWRLHRQPLLAATGAAVVVAAGTVAGLAWSGPGDHQTAGVQAINPGHPGVHGKPGKHKPAQRRHDGRGGGTNTGGLQPGRSTSPAATVPGTTTKPHHPSHGHQPRSHRPTPAGLQVRVALSRTTIHLGQSVRVHYTWSDGDGHLVSTNHVGPSARHTVRNVPCRHKGGPPHPITRHGTWVFTPEPGLYEGPVDLPADIKVGLEVRTGGCAAVEDVTAVVTLRLLPALPGHGKPASAERTIPSVAADLRRYS